MIGIVILNYENWNETVECISTIYEYRPTLDVLRLYVVDNGSKNKPSDDFKRLQADNNDIELLESKANLGFARGNNIGIRKAREDNCDFVIVSNSDVYYRENSIDELIKFYSNHTGICYPKIYDLEGNVPYIPYSFDTSIKQIYFRHTILKNIFKNTFKRLCENYIYMDSKEPIENYFNAGSCYCIDKKSLDVLKQLDEHTFLYYEEMILSRRANVNGIHIYYCPSSQVTHAIGKSTEGGGPFSKGCMHQSAIYYARNYLKSPKYQVFPLYIYMLMVYRLKAITDKRYRTGFKDYKERIRKYL